MYGLPGMRRVQTLAQHGESHLNHAQFLLPSSLTYCGYIIGRRNYALYAYIYTAVSISRVMRCVCAVNVPNYLYVSVCVYM